MALAEALVGDDDDALHAAREAALAALGPEGLVDAVAVASNFQRMVRIADGTGIPLDGPLRVVSEELRDQLGLERFAASANTPASSAASRLAGRLIRPVAFRLMRLVGRSLDRGSPGR